MAKPKYEDVEFLTAEEEREYWKDKGSKFVNSERYLKSLLEMPKISK